MKHTNKKIERHHKSKCRRILWIMRNMPSASKGLIQAARNFKMPYRSEG